MIINNKDNAEYLINVYLYFSDSVRKRILIKYSVGDSIDEILADFYTDVQKKITKKREYNNTVYLLKADYSIIALDMSKNFYRVGCWIDDRTGIKDFTEVLQQIEGV